MSSVYQCIWTCEWPWWLRWRELPFRAAGSPSQHGPPALPGAEGWPPAWSECLSLRRTAAALMRSSSGSSWLQCGEGCSHSRGVRGYRVTNDDISSAWFQLYVLARPHRSHTLSDHLQWKGLQHIFCLLLNSLHNLCSGMRRGSFFQQQESHILVVIMSCHMQRGEAILQMITFGWMTIAHLLCFVSKTFSLQLAITI